MAASSARGDSASGSEEAEVLACHHAVEFALGFWRDRGFGLSSCGWICPWLGVQRVSYWRR